MNFFLIHNLRKTIKSLLIFRGLSDRFFTCCLSAKNVQMFHCSFQNISKQTFLTLAVCLLCLCTILPHTTVKLI